MGDGPLADRSAIKIAAPDFRLSRNVYQSFTLSWDLLPGRNGRRPRFAQTWFEELVRPAALKNSRTTAEWSSFTIIRFARIRALPG